MRYLVIGLALLLSGCAGFSPEVGEALNRAEAVKRLAAIEPVPLTVDQPVEHAITESSPVYAFDTGKSYTALFALPAHRPGRVLEIKSYCRCIGLTKGVFIPIAYTLDEQYRQLRQVSFQTHSPTRWEPVHYVGEIAPEAPERYVVLYTDPKRFGAAADPVSATIVHERRERMDYIHEGYTQVTYTEQQAGVWWEGDAVGELSLRVKDAGTD